MSFELVIGIIAIVISFISVIWSGWYNLSAKKSSRTNKTIELALLFNTSEFHNSRGIGWYLLDKVNKNETPITFDALWKDTGNQTATIKFTHLYKVLSFWQTLHILGKQNEIDTKLANKLFKYEFSWWYDQSRKLVNNTLNSGEKPPDFMEVFRDSPKWLSE